MLILQSALRDLVHSLERIYSYTSLQRLKVSARIQQLLLAWRFLIQKPQRRRGLRSHTHHLLEGLNRSFVYFPCRERKKRPPSEQTSLLLILNISLTHLDLCFTRIHQPGKVKVKRRGLPEAEKLSLWTRTQWSMMALRTRHCLEVSRVCLP